MSEMRHFSLAEPPEFLFGAVSVEFIDNVMRNGLNSVTTPFIELYEDADEAKRHIHHAKYTRAFTVLAGLMAEREYAFSVSEDRTWTTKEVPMKYIRLS